MVLLEARHAEFGDALRSDEELVVDGEPFNPRLHLAMHQVVASQLLADDPPETGRRFSGWPRWATTGTRSCT